MRRTARARAGTRRRSQRNGMAISPRKHRVGPSLEANENFSPTSVQERPNTTENRGVLETREQDDSTTCRTRRSLQNLHPRFKSGRRLQFHSANPELLEARTRGKGATSLVSRRAWPDLPHPVSRTSARSGGHRGNRASRQRLPRHSIDRFFQAIEHDKNLEQRVRAKAEMYFDEVFPHGEPMSDGSWVETIPPDFGFEDLILS
jgi:hypothetical protein